MIKKNPITDDAAIEDSNPNGASLTAFRVSSHKCAEASKPKMVYCDINTPTTATYAGDALMLHPS